MKPYSVETPTACCCCNFFFLTATCDRIAVISPTFQPIATQCVCLRVLVLKHTMHVSTDSNPTHFSAGPCGQAHYVRYKQVHFLTPKILCFSPDELPQCDAICHMCSKYRCVPTPRPPRVRPNTIPFTIASIIVSLPRLGGESDHISFPRSVMRMCLIMMLNSLLFPRFCFCFCTSNTNHSNRFQTHTHALGPPVSGIEETNNNPYLHVIPYRSRRAPLPTLPRSLPVPRMKRFTFDVASCSR